MPDPPESLKKYLLTLHLKNFNQGVDMNYWFRGAGASHNGTMKKSQFFIALKRMYKEFTFTDALVWAIADNYGVGDIDPNDGNPNEGDTGRTHIAWKDFIEDVDKCDRKLVTQEIDGYCRAGAATLGLDLGAAA